MSYLGSAEIWESEYGIRISQSLASLSRRQRIQILLSAGLVSGIEISNRLSINVLLPDMQGNVAGSPDDISWVVILYNLGFLCSMAISFWMTRRLGTRRHLLYSIALYALGAFGCFLSAHSLTLLLVSRVVMGFGGGAFLVRTVILSALMFPGKARIQAVTWLYLELAFFQLLYPTAIGFIADHLHWNYAFLIDFPFLAIATVLILKFVPRGYLFLRNKNEYLDLWGAGLLVAGLSAMQVALSRGERDDWLASPLILSFLVISVICFALFLWWDWRTENTSPVLHLRMLWRQLPLRLSLAAIAVVGALLGAGLYVLPQYLRHVQDFSTTQTGEFISGFTGGLMVGLLISLRYMLPRIGGWWVTCAGATMLFATCVTFLYVWTPTTPTSLLWALIFLQGASLAPMLVGVSNVATGQAQVADLNDVTTTFFFVRQLGNTFGVTAATVLFDRRMTLHSSRLIDTANALDPTLQSTLSAYSGLIARNGGAGANPQQGALQIFQSNVVVQSSLLSYIDVYFMLAVLSAAVIVLMTIARLRAQAAAAANAHGALQIW